MPIELEHYPQSILKTGDYDKDKNLLARVTVEGSGRSLYSAAMEEKDPLFDAITKRRTNRSKFENKRPPEHILSELKTDISQQNSIWLEIAEGD